MSDWDPGQYLRFGEPRLRPALELLARIDVEDPDIVVDAGCGPGNVTPFLADRWPRARYVGVDRSAAMLASARAEHPDLVWTQADLSVWRPDQPADVIYSNAALHWLDDHDKLLPDLLRHLAPGGVAAIQMPHNHDAPTHTAIAYVIEGGPWADRLRPIFRSHPVGEPDFYFDILDPHTAEIDIWETEYLHVLTGENAVAEWTKGSVLRPILAALDEAESREFFDRYSVEIARRYPRRQDGRTLLPFRRMFIVARV